MARKADGAGKVRAELEGVSLTLVDIEEALPFVHQRITQAIRRSGLHSLLSPALEDLERMAKDVQQAKSQVGVAVTKLMER